MNKIMNEILVARNGHYCHCVEVFDIDTLETITDYIYDSYREKYGLEEVLDFLETMTIYYLPYEEGQEIPKIEEQVYIFSFRYYIMEHLETNYV